MQIYIHNKQICLYAHIYTFIYEEKCFHEKSSIRTINRRIRETESAWGRGSILQSVVMGSLSDKVSFE